MFKHKITKRMINKKIELMNCCHVLCITKNILGEKSAIDVIQRKTKWIPVIFTKMVQIKADSIKNVKQSDESYAGLKNR